MPERRQVALLLRCGAVHIEARSIESPTAVVMRHAARLLEEAERVLAGPGLTKGAMRMLDLLQRVGPLTGAEIVKKLAIVEATERKWRRELLDAGLIRDPEALTWEDHRAGLQSRWEAVDAG